MVYLGVMFFEVEACIFVQFIFSWHFYQFLIHDVYRNLDERFNLLIHVRKIFQNSVFNVPCNS